MDDDYTDSLESAIGGVETAVEQMETAVEIAVEIAAGRVAMAVARVEAAVKDKLSTPQLVGIRIVGAFLWSLPGTIWHAKWRYTADYGIPSSKIYVQNKPHDCTFLAAPLGEKYCH